MRIKTEKYIQMISSIKLYILRQIATITFEVIYLTEFIFLLFINAAHKNNYQQKYKIEFQQDSSGYAWKNAQAICEKKLNTLLKY